MAVNTVVLSGEVKKVDVNTKPTKKGPAAVILLQYGPNRSRTDQAVQFLNVALVRVPPYVYEKCKDHLKVGVLVDVVGHLQGVLKQVMAGDNFVTNEVVADRLQIVDIEGDGDAPADATAEAAAAE